MPNTGTVILSGTNSYTGTTTVAPLATLEASLAGALAPTSAFTVSGTLDLAGFSNRIGSLAGTGTVTDTGVELPTAPDVLTMGNTTATTFSGVIQDGANATVKVIKVGSSTLTLSGTNTYSGGTTISAGTLKIGNGAALGSIIGNVTDNAILTFSLTGTPVPFAGVISGTGSLSQTGTGAVTLTGASSYTGGTIISAGTLQIGSGGSIIGNVTDNANLTFNLTGTPAPFSMAVSGSGALNQIGTGTVILSGANTYSGGTTITAGTLQIGDGTSGSITGGVVDNANLAFNLGGSQAVAGIISGSGTLIQAGAGTLTLSGANTYTGGTNFNAGTLAVAAAGSLGSGPLVFNGGTLEALASGGGITSAKAVTLNTAGGSFLADALTSSTWSGTITGAGAFTKTGAGTLTLSGSSAAYGGGTNFNGGILVDNIGGGGQLGTGAFFFNGGTLEATSGLSLPTGITLNALGGTFLALGGSNSTLSGVIQGTGPFTKSGSGNLLLSGNNTFSGGLTVSGGVVTLTGTNANVSSTSIASGAVLSVGNGGMAGSLAGNVVDNGTLVFNRNSGLTFSGSVSGSGGLSQTSSGRVIVSGTSTYTGATNVGSGVLEVDGTLGNTVLSVQSGAVLSGQGTIAGTVTILSGGHLGTGGQTLGTGSLLLNSGSILDYVLSTPGVIGSGVNSLVNVTGNLTLGGILNVTNGGSFGSGSYRLINYSGTLSDPPLVLGTLPAGFSPANVLVSNGTVGQINMIVSDSGSPSQFWDGATIAYDGAIRGGTGTWNNVTTNFTDGVSANSSWQGGIAVFSGTAGTVTLGDDILFQGMDFTVNNYSVAGAGAFGLNPVGTAAITTETGVAAAISAPINGTGGLDKEGAGTLVLSGTNGYSGGTTVGGGILSVASDSNLGAVSGGVIMGGGELLTSVDGFNSARTVDVGPIGGTLAAVSGTTATFTGVLSDTGALTVGDGTNAGKIVLSGTNTYSGGTNLNGGTLAVGSDSNLGTGRLTFDGGILEATASLNSAKAITLSAGGGTVITASGFTTTLSGVIGGNGSLSNNGGTLVLTGANTYTGGTTISGGLFRLGNGGTTGSIGGNVLDNGILTFNHSDNVTFPGIISGTGSLEQRGPGILTLTGANTFGGGVLVDRGGVLRVDNDAELGVAGVGITLQNGELESSVNFTSNRPIDSVVPVPAGSNILAAAAGTTGTYSGVISGGNGLVIGDVVNSGIVLLSNIGNSYTGGTTVTGAATLSVSSDTTLGDASGGIALKNGELLTTAAFSSGRGILLGGAVANILAAGTGTTATYTGVLTGAGRLSVGAGTNGGTVVLTGNNDYSGGTNLNGGVLAVHSDNNLGTGNLSFNGGTLEALTSIGSEKSIRLNAGGGTFSADEESISDLDGPISGPGSLTETGAGYLVITGAGTYTGGTTVNGVLFIDEGGTTGSIVGNVVDNGLVGFQRSDTVTFAGNVSGTGAFNQNGPGTLILTGTSTYTGATTVASGATLQVDGGLGNTALTVQNAAILSGQGTIGGTVTIADGAHLAPGPGAQTLGVGNLVLSSGSILDYVLSNPGVIGSGVNSLVNVWREPDAGRRLECD